MWRILFIFGIFGIISDVEAFAEVFSSRCNVKKCSSLLPDIVMNLDTFLPDAEDLKEKCPKLLEYIQCVTVEVDTCTTKNLAELASSSNQTVAGMADVFLGLSGLVMDLCDVESRLHISYASHIGCVRNTIEKYETEAKCMPSAVKSFEDYATRPGIFKRPYNHKECFIASYAFACVSEEVQKDCNSAAQQLFMTLIKKSKLLKRLICTPDAVVELKTTFFHFLELHGERRNIYRHAFDLRKKK